MARAITLVIVFFLSMNLFSGMLVSTGAAQDIGLGSQLEVGGDEDVEQLNQSSSEISSGAPTGQTLFGMYNVLAGFLSTVRVVAFGGPSMLYNAGVPGSITGPIEILIGFVYAVGIVSFLRGWSL